MGTDETGNTREYLRKHLKGTYSEAELDAIAAALEKDPDLLTPVTDTADIRGLEDPTGTCFSLGHLGPIELHAPAGEPVHFHDPRDGPWASFNVADAELEELARSMAHADAITDRTIKEVHDTWPTRPQKKQIRAFIPYDDLRGLTEKEREDRIQEEHLNVISRLRDLGCIKMETSETNNRTEDRVEITGTGYKP